MKLVKLYAIILMTGIFFVNGYGQQLKGDWKLVEMKSDGKTFTFVGDKVPTLNFEANYSFFGYSGCNNYRAGYEIQEREIKIKTGISTKMACVDDQSNTKESLFLGMFEKLKKYKISKKTFVLYSPDKRYVLKFVHYNRIRPL